MNNIGRIISDFYCNGYFGREYDHANAIILAEGDDFLVIKKSSGEVVSCSFQNADFQPIPSEKRQELIDNWCVL